MVIANKPFSQDSAKAALMQPLGNWQEVATLPTLTSGLVVAWSATSLTQVALRRDSITLHEIGEFPKEFSYELKNPILAVVNFEDDIVSMIAVPVDEYGQGATVREAEEDLVSSIVEYYEWLQKNRARLSKALQRDLDLLSTILKRRE